MEIKAELKKPYTNEQRIKFIVENNHKKGYVIEESATSLVALGMTEDEKTQEEQQRIAMLSLTSADVERGIYKATGKDFDDVVALVTELQPVGLDIKALKIELKANNFYRGNPYVDSIGTLLGFSKEQLDMFFQYNNYKYLLTENVVEVENE